MLNHFCINQIYSNRVSVSSIISRLTLSSGPSRRDNRKSRHMGNPNTGRYSHGKSLLFYNEEATVVDVMMICHDWILCFFTVDDITATDQQSLVTGFKSL